MEEKFSSLQELYERLTPALKSKKMEMHRSHMIYINEPDIWNYFRETKWNKGVNLTLFDMVDDILNTENDEIDSFIRRRRAETKKEEDLF